MPHTATSQLRDNHSHDCGKGADDLNLFQEKLRDVFLAVLPVTLLVLLLHLTLTPVGGLLLASFLVGSVLIILGLTLFLVGVDLGVTPL